MSAGAPWSVKGIDPKAREVAKDLARRSGLTLGEWLNRIILEDDVPDEVTHEGQFADRPLRAVGAPPQLRAVAAAPPPDLARVAHALDRLTDRIEASETRTGLAINGVEHSVRQALARIETAEREQTAQTLRLEGLLAESSAQQSYFGERLRRIEAEPANSDIGPRSAEALRAIEARLARAEPEVVVEAVLQRLGDRLALAESRTAAALGDLQGSLAGLDRRLAAVEGGAVGGEPIELKFEALAQVLTAQVESARAEVAEKLAQAGDGALEARFAELTDQVRIAEQRSAQAVEAIGRQVLSMAEAVGRKLTEVDERSAGAIDQVGTEVARIAGAVELRLARQEHVQAEAFERLQAELAKVTGTLTERLAVSEQRAAAALDDVEAEVARVTGLAGGEAPAPSPQAAAPSGYAAAELVAPEPTLAEIIQSLGPPPEPEPEAVDLAEPAPAALGPELFSRAEPELGPEPPAEVVEPPWRRLDLDVPEPEIPEVFAPLAEDEDEALFEPKPAAAPELSTREVIERARAAARANQDQPVEVRAKVGPKAATGRLFQGFGPKPKKPAPNTALQTAMMIAGGAAFLSVGAAGLTLMQGPAAPAEQASLPENPRAAMALGPAQLTTQPQDATNRSVVAPVFAEVRADVEGGVPGALAQLTTLAETGHPQAQLYLAQLYDGGDAGLPQNPTEARRWTALAAENGDVKAMHNLAVYEFRGEGGPQDLVSAARWFRKAADAGVVESQYNLGLLYQSGSGVEQNLAAAKQWFARAAARGDAEARRALAALAPARAAPVHAPAAAPKAKAAAPPRPIASASATPTLGGVSMNVRQTQMVLTRLGYFTGPIDGRDSLAYHRALAEYRRDQDGGTPLYTAER
jgi:localization factor PodJL